MKKLIKVGLIFFILALTLLLATPANAADLRGDDTIIISSEDVINDDLYLVGNSIIINGTVNGDVVCIGNHITMAGHVNGNITIIGATTEIEGEVTHSVRETGSNVTVSGKIGRDMLAAGDEIDLTKQADIGIAFDKMKQGILFKKGKPIYKVNNRNCIDALLKEINK